MNLKAERDAAGHVYFKIVTAFNSISEYKLHHPEKVKECNELKKSMLPALVKIKEIYREANATWYDAQHGD